MALAKHRKVVNKLLTCSHEMSYRNFLKTAYFSFNFVLSLNLLSYYLQANASMPVC